jgi:hypothetical protein
MATTKKKTTAKKRPATTSPKKKTTRSKKVAPMQSFRIYKDAPTFTTFRVTRQTLYWTILLLFIIITQLWILKVQLDIAALTDTILAQ